MNKNILITSLLILLITPLCFAVTDSDMQNGCVLYFVLANTTDNMNGVTIKDWSGQANGTMGNMVCSSGLGYCDLNNTNSYITFTAKSLGDQTAFANTIQRGTLSNAEILAKDNTGSMFIMLIGATGVGDVNTYGTAYTKSNPISANVQSRITVQRSGANVNYYINGTNRTVDPDGGSAAIITGQVGRTNTGTAIGRYYLIAMWNRSLTADEIAYLETKTAADNLYNPFANTSTPAPTISFNTPTPADNTAQYRPDNSTIKTSVTINNQTGLNSTIRLYLNGTGLINSTPNSTAFNFTSLSSGTYYINASLINSDGSINTSTDTRRIDLYTINNTINTPTSGSSITRYINMTFNSNTTSSLVNISTQKIYLNGSSLANLTTNTSFNYDTYTQNYTTGSYNLSMNITDTQGKSIYNSILINFTTNAIINITAVSIISGTGIQNFSLNITDQNTGITTTYSDNNISAFIDIKKNWNYSLTVDAPGYSYLYQNITTTNQTNQNITLSLYTENSISINIFDETTNLLILENITMVFTQGLTQLTNTTTTGQYYQDGLADGSWTIKFSESPRASPNS